MSSSNTYQDLLFEALKENTMFSFFSETAILKLIPSFSFQIASGGCDIASTPIDNDALLVNLNGEITIEPFDGAITTVQRNQTLILNRSIKNSKISFSNDHCIAFCSLKSILDWKRAHDIAFSKSISIGSDTTPDSEIVLKASFHDSNYESKEPLTTLLKIMSHDLRSPMAAIITLTDILQSESDTMDKSEIDETIIDLNHLSEGLLKLTDQLLHWAKITSKKESLRPSYFSLVSLINELLAEKAEQVKHKNLKVNFTFTQNITIHTDRSLTMIVLRNILSNAIKYSTHGAEIQVRLQKNERDEADIIISDQGTGISEKIMQKIESDQLLSSTPGTDGESGFGLGLFISRDFAKLISASIEIKSNPGNGTVALFTLPKSN